jgi:aryl-alcohol dehydrogenase-like predicted oxidoreductase
MMSPTDLRHVGSTGVRLSVLGVGTGSLANSGGANQFDSMIEAAWSGGLRHFDTAALYLNGESERRLGAAMRGKPREAYALSTKAGRYSNESGSHFDYSRDGFMRSVEVSLSRLQVDWLDIVMIHDLDPEHHGAGPHVLKRTRAIEAICRRYEVHIAAAALQFPLQHPAVTSVVAGHRAPEEITVNLQRLRCPIPAAFWSETAAETAGLARHD